VVGSCGFDENPKILQDFASVAGAVAVAVALAVPVVAAIGYVLRQV